MGCVRGSQVGFPSPSLYRGAAAGRLPGDNSASTLLGTGRPSEVLTHRLVTQDTFPVCKLCHSEHKHRDPCGSVFRPPNSCLFPGPYGCFQIEYMTVTNR